MAVDPSEHVRIPSDVVKPAEIESLGFKKVDEVNYHYPVTGERVLILQVVDSCFDLSLDEPNNDDFSRIVLHHRIMLYSLDELRFVLSRSSRISALFS